MSDTHAPPKQQPAPLYKQRSWSPDTHRDEAWLKRKGRRNQRSKSLTDEDLDELKACIELGFGFDSPVLDPRLSDTFPALGFYFAVNKHYQDTVSKSSSSPASDCDSSSPFDSPHTIFLPGNCNSCYVSILFFSLSVKSNCCLFVNGEGDNPETVKTRLRQWAQLVACSVHQSSSSSSWFEGLIPDPGRHVQVTKRQTFEWSYFPIDFCFLLSKYDTEVNRKPAAIGLTYSLFGSLLYPDCYSIILLVYIKFFLVWTDMKKV